MANPQPDKFTRISNELYEAIMQTDFTKRQRNILDLIIRMSYGCGKKFAILRPSDFSLVGVHRNHVSSELRYLENANVIKIDGDVIWLNKNYDQWRVSLVKTFDQERFNKVLQRNLAGNPNATETVANDTELVADHENNDATEMVSFDTKTVADATKTVAQEKTEEEKCHQNSDTDATKMVAYMPNQPSNDAGSERPKEILKKSIKAVVSSSGEDPFNLLADKYVQRRGYGFDLSPNDTVSITNVLKSGVDVEDALAWIDECFDNYKPKYQGDRIRSFSYVEKYIMDRHYRKQALEQNRREANAAYQNRNRGDPGASEEDVQAGYFTSIPGLIRTV